ncbi:ParA family protein [Herbiconiux liukaitaii]|uniref:ParA family protein n=1 Tax=Herbiconiux liukaitaii TaxID=3342799 RepID=UPI0035BB40DE
MKVVAVYSTKGGVGKTTAAVNLAWEASKEFRVLLWDLDPQGATTYLLQVKPKVKGGVGALVAGDSKVAGAIRSTAFEHLDVLPADASYRDLDLVFDSAKKSERRVAKILEQVEKDYDVVILDCPPGASLVAENAIFSADAVVVPLVPSPLSMRSLEQVTAFVADSVSKAPVVAFLSMVDRRKTQHREAVEQLPAAHKAVTEVVVPATVLVERMGSERAPLGSYAPGAEAARAYGTLWSRVQTVVKLKPRKAPAPAQKSAPRKGKR